MDIFKLKFIFFAALLLGLAACGSGGDSSDGDSDSSGNGSSDNGGTTTQNVDDVVTTGITFVGGALKDGAPPAPTNNQGDVSLTTPSSTPAEITPGQSSSLDITLNDMPAGQNFDINVRFGSSNNYINIPIDDSNGVITGLVNSGGTGTLNLPFSLPANICDNVADIQHQIACFESVDVGGGVVVSKETARQLLLDCGIGDGGFATGDNSFCSDDTSQEVCDNLRDGINNNQLGVIAVTRFALGSTCSQSFPNATVLPDVGDATCSGLGLPNCGACAVDVNVSNVTSKPDPLALEQSIYDQLIQFQNNPEARRRITFTP